MASSLPIRKSWSTLQQYGREIKANTTLNVSFQLPPLWHGCNIDLTGSSRCRVDKSGDSLIQRILTWIYSIAAYLIHWCSLSCLESGSAGKAMMSSLRAYIVPANCLIRRQICSMSAGLILAPSAKDVHIWNSGNYVFRIQFLLELTKMNVSRPYSVPWEYFALFGTLRIYLSHTKTAILFRFVLENTGFLNPITLLIIKKSNIDFHWLPSSNSFIIQFMKIVPFCIKLITN